MTGQEVSDGAVKVSLHLDREGKRQAGHTVIYSTRKTLEDATWQRAASIEKEQTPFLK